MITRSAKTTRASRRTPARRPAARPAPTVTPVRMEEVKAQLDVAGQALQRVGRAATRFARSSVQEVTLAGRASREPMHQVWRAVRLAGRHIARDAVAAWNEAVPVAARPKKPARASAAA